MMLSSVIWDATVNACQILYMQVCNISRNISSKYVILWLVFTWSPYHWSLVEITPELITPVCTTFVFHDLLWHHNGSQNHKECLMVASQWVMMLLGTFIVMWQWVLTLLYVHIMASQCLMMLLLLLCITMPNYNIAVSPVNHYNITHTPLKSTPNQ